MIGKPEWFSRRKYGGWGLYPKSKEGWVYILVVMLPLFLFHLLPFWSASFRFVVTGVFLLFFSIDILNIMFHLKKDEREIKHEALAERNASWTMVTILVIGLLYEIMEGALVNEIKINWLILLALFGGALAKSITNIKLEKTK